MNRDLLNVVRKSTLLTLLAVAGGAWVAAAPAQLSALKAPARQVAPAHPEATATQAPASPWHGAWQGSLQGPQQRMLYQMILAPDGTFKARIIIERHPLGGAPVEPTITPYEGQWQIEGDDLVLRNQGTGDVERTPIELRGDQLIMKGIGPDGQSLSLQRVPPVPGPGPGPTGPPRGAGSGPAGQPSPATGPRTPQPDQGPPPVVPAAPRSPLAGTWYGSGLVEDTGLSCQLTMQPNGTYQVEFVFRDRGVTSRVSEQGRWQVQGPSIAFESEADFSLVPFQLRGESLMLDYRDQAGLVAILSRTPGQGQIHSVDSGDDD